MLQHTPLNRAPVTLGRSPSEAPNYCQGLHAPIIKRRYFGVRIFGVRRNHKTNKTKHVWYDTEHLWYRTKIFGNIPKVLCEHTANADSKCRCARSDFYQIRASENHIETDKRTRMVLGSRRNAEAAQVKSKGPAAATCDHTECQDCGGNGS